MKHFLCGFLLVSCVSVYWLINRTLFRDVHPHPWSPQVYAPSVSRPVETSFLNHSLASASLPHPGHEALYDPLSLTAILPVSERNLQDLDTMLLLFLRPSIRLREVVIICPDSILSKARRQVSKAMEVAKDHDHPELLLRSWSRITDQNAAVLHAASHVTTEWVLLLDDNGIRHIDNRTLGELFGRADQILYGPIDTTGMILLRSDMSCASVFDFLRSRVPFSPPLVLPMSLFPENTVRTGQDAWVHLHQRFLDQLSVASQAVGNPLSVTEFGWCTPSLSNETEVLNLVQPHIVDNVAHVSPPLFYAQENDTVHTGQVGHFAVILSSLQDLDTISFVLCKLLNRSYQIRILVMSGVIDSQDCSMFSGGCCLNYELPTSESTGFRMPSGADPLAWLETLPHWPDVILTLAEEPSTAQLHMKIQQLPTTTLVRLSREDLPYSFWMGTLSITEWKNWNTPRVDISVITKDRPRSLRRLLSSLINGRYFGDILNLRVNMEQSSDIETMRIVEHFQWKHGSMFVHHRVIHGGLLPAVVESWYPQSNDSYGLLLEDDVELSPLAYAWIKMSILRYRYGEESNQSPQLFGISLYQQKIIELRPEGRQPFDAKKIFSDFGFSPTIPYLSQIPCSWGAVYFPQHWKEFHAYLSWRLSEVTIKITENVVPDIRSNKWSKSWKKYFIELAYLRGYVMLYPNYDAFVSLSTNHVEVGSHVKDRSKEKKDQFVLPLMALSDIQGRPSTGLVDLPGGTLPDWQRLPILNLTGSLTTLETITHVGCLRKTELRRPTCSGNVRHLACIHGTFY